RQSYVEVLRAGLEMPPEGSRVTRQLHLYCADPRDGVAKFRFTTPRRVAADVQQTEPRDSLATAAVSVDSRAKPFRERLELDVAIDDNLILTADIRSLNAKDATTVHLH